MAQIGTQILNPESQVFELLDNQRAAFSLCRAVINDTFVATTSAAPLKKVVIILGPPGSGKSVIAARLWASLVTDPAVPDGDIVFTTTSMSQNSNWSHLFDQARKTKDDANPHALPADLMDFHEPYEVNGQTRLWSRVWNVVGPGDNYTWYVTGHPAGRIASDPLCEVGCTYAVRGFDYDYVGILWLNDLIWRDNRWRVDPNAVEETGVIDLIRRARREVESGASDGTATSQLLQRVAQAYRILFTRALKGVYVWVSDPETRAHLASSISER